MSLALLVAPPAALAAGARGAGDWRDELYRNVWDPWFIFGMGAQGIFFFRFVIQWIVSEKRRRSTIPVTFWYLSLVGAAATFVYAAHEAQPVFMLGQVVACVIYVRNLMLIHGRARRLRRAGLSGKGAVELDEELGD